MAMSDPRSVPAEEKTNIYQKFNFRDTTGYVFHQPEGLIALGHTASVASWSDPNIHQHELSEEYYVLLKGQLDFLVADFRLTLHPNEILMLKPGVPHAILGGTGPIEHFGIRAPAPDDKRIAGPLKKDAPYLIEEEQRCLSGEWGHRIPLDMPQHKNCWLIGAGSAFYPSQHLILAYLDFPTEAEANPGMGTRHQLHLHQKSWEYYVVLKGEKDILLIEDIHVAIGAGEILEVPPHVKHTLHRRAAPYLGFTMRIPVALNDKIIVEA
jgi:mannose-6-phosphate isomerase-like protein (cupin superfamily)